LSLYFLAGVPSVNREFNGVAMGCEEIAEYTPDWFLVVDNKERAVVQQDLVFVLTQGKGHVGPSSSLS
jgi:hypothetical protein